MTAALSFLERAWVNARYRSLVRSRRRVTVALAASLALFLSVSFAALNEQVVVSASAKMNDALELIGARSPGARAPGALKSVKLPVGGGEEFGKTKPREPEGVIPPAPPGLIIPPPPAGGPPTPGIPVLPELPFVPQGIPPEPVPPPGVPPGGGGGGFPMPPGGGGGGGFPPPVLEEPVNPPPPQNPPSNPVPAVPEPQTWMMMILGFGSVGFMIRRRRRSPNEPGRAEPAPRRGG